MLNIKFDYNNHTITNLNNELKCMYIYNYFKDTKENIVVVTNSLYEANYLYQSLFNYTDDVLLFPMDDFLSSVALAISPELKVTRLETLNGLNKNKIIVTNLMGYLRYIPEKNYYFNKCINLKVNDEIDIDDLANKLYSVGYTRETLANKTGDYAKRGYVIDVFLINEQNPIRIEFFGDIIESIRVIDVNTQLTIDKKDSITIYPNTEFLIENPDFNIDYKDITNYIKTTNISNFNESTVFFNNYDDISITYKNLVEEMFNYSIENNYESDTKYMNDFTLIKNNKEYYFNNFDNVESNKTINIEPFTGSFDLINKRLDNYLNKYKKVVICVSNKKEVNKIINELNNKNIVFTDIDNLSDNKINVIIYKINDGFIYNNIVVISKKEIFNEKNTNIKYKTNFKIGTRIKDISKIDIGDYVVHNTHGIGKYIGIKTLTKNDIKKDYIVLEYKDNDKLYIPVEKIDLIYKYSSSDGYVPKISKLGGTDWQKTKLNAKKQTENIAKELLKLYALRESSKGFAFKKDNEMQIQFEKEFPYQDTKDQIKVVEEIKLDMEKDIPMNRLVCGDVGYGKTEIAFRAMFKAILSGKQVALLCPTTILSQQHFQNAIERFKSFPVDICILNRFVSPKQLKENIKRINEGKVDIVIGTHRLLSEDIKFKKLGLLVVDEEQRFGVKHKEKINEYQKNVDIITLSATPIPRTLQMSLSGLRDLSLLETPPSNRYPVQTYVLKDSNQIMKDAIYKELSRNGQVFILYNNINNMDIEKQKILSLVPQAKIVTAHGKMDKNELENIMYSFIKKEYDILLCTTIIETGIDIPNVNTLIIKDADKFGLSQLYQIRGRVGRSDRIAYCYLMYDNSKILNEIAVKRLNIIKEFTELGSGYKIAMRDLSIRGAGNILGSEQSGFVDSVGVEMFTRMLREEIEILKGHVVNKELDTQPLIDIETSIDDKYVKETDLKIEIHKMINEIDSIESLYNIKSVLEDRFGKLPDNLVIYMYEELFEKLATNLGITEIKQTKSYIEINIPKEILDNLDGKKLFSDLYKLNKNIRFTSHFSKTYILLDLMRLDKHFIYYLIDILKIINECKIK